MKKSKSLFTITLSTILIAAFLLSAAACPVSASNGKVIRVGVSGGMAPLLYIDDGVPDGLFVDIMNSLGRISNMEIKYQSFVRHQDASAFGDSLYYLPIQSPICVG